MRWIKSQPGPDKYLDHFEKAILRAGVQATALIEQSKGEVERIGDFDPTYLHLEQGQEAA